MKRICFPAVVLIALGCGKSTSAPEVPKLDPADAKAVAAASNEFAVDLYGQLRENKGNLFFSPYSVSSALGMTYAGAAGQTAEEMAKTLHLTLKGDQLHAAMGGFQRSLQSEGKDGAPRVAIANALWGQKGLEFRPEFVDLARKHYGAEISQVDFLANPEAARQTINAWVGKQTQNKIQELILKDILSDQSRLVLTNAIYFKGDWAVSFRKSATTEAPFHLLATNKVKVPMMKNRDNFRAAEDSDLQILELPYVGKQLSMVVMLPKEVDGLSTFEKSLSASKLAELLDGLREHEVTLSVPRFKIASTSDLNDSLKKLGMVRAYDPKEADFSGVTLSSAKEQLKLSDVLHRAVIEVNEEGTEAAAATAVHSDVKAAAVRPMTFTADHPFLFLIRDNQSGAILLMGRLVDPSKD